MLAARLVEDNDVLIIEEGSTAMQIILHLTDKRNFTFLVCSIPTLTLLLEFQRNGRINWRTYLSGEK
ncbi:hypothetical protein [Paenibacillus sp. ATY16]|uniref:hypothetical protein n=1 Tax=Paenibacillus sp. ATY16 TaxID=1759312 RepID=UPI00200E9A97|nr:hypothetical protein [Paenibacillus sp. ATY16]